MGQGGSEAVHRLQLLAFLRYGRPSSGVIGAFGNGDAPQALLPFWGKSKGIAGCSRNAYNCN